VRLTSKRCGGDDPKGTIKRREAWKEIIAMNKWIMTALCVGLASLAQAADGPFAAPASQPVVGPVGAACCQADCGAKVCVPVAGIKKRDKVIYDEKCVDYCIPRCSLWSIFSGQCGCGGEAGCQNCGQPHTKRLLVKRIVHEECPDVKCEVQAAPCAAYELPAAK
jgi:hypothetical protein